MAGAALRFFFYSVATATNYMGTTLFAVGANIVLFLVVLSVLFVTKGKDAMEKHWLQNVGIGFIVLVVFWIGLIGWATIKNLYDDHLYLKQTAAKRLIIIRGVDGSGGLLNDNQVLANTINDFKSKLHDLQQQYDVLKDSKQYSSLEDRDPDSLYQLDTNVGKLLGVIIDSSHSQIMYQTLRYNGDYDPSQPADFRNLRVNCGNLQAAPPGMGNNFSAVVVGGVCKIVGAAKAP